MDDFLTKPLAWLAWLHCPLEMGVPEGIGVPEAGGFAAITFGVLEGRVPEAIGLTAGVLEGRVPEAIGCAARVPEGRVPGATEFTAGVLAGRVPFDRVEEVPPVKMSF